MGDRGRDVQTRKMAAKLGLRMETARVTKAMKKPHKNFLTGVDRIGFNSVESSASKRRNQCIGYSRDYKTS